MYYDIKPIKWDFYSFKITQNGNYTSRVCDTNKGIDEMITKQSFHQFPFQWPIALPSFDSTCYPSFSLLNQQINLI